MIINDTAAPTRRVIRGDSDSIKLQFNNTYKNHLGIKVKKPIDITGWDIKFTVRATVPSTSISSDVDAAISKTATILDGKSGTAYINIKPKDTNINEGNYWYDIQYTKNVGTDNEYTQSLSKGKYVIVGDITRSAG